ncbi:hypothetical protein J4Q44_G00235000 [Coregonus suidteri]|uniref:Uncharacterized protein n=1 Tax=Coregonus suidteri TaxID=861788 RepID=A0AAN8QKP8_9TELE
MLACLIREQTQMFMENKDKEYEMICCCYPRPMDTEVPEKVTCYCELYVNPPVTAVRTKMSSLSHAVSYLPVTSERAAVDPRQSLLTSLYSEAHVPLKGLFTSNLTLHL